MFYTETERDWREIQDDRIAQRNEFFAREAHDDAVIKDTNPPTPEYGVPKLINGEWGVDVNHENYYTGDLQAGDIINVRTKSGNFFKVRLKLEVQQGLFLTRKLY